jgi:hypothetical protein
MYLARVEISNLRAIAQLTLDFSAPGATGEPRRWTVLLGENGCGKSTILKAIGLVLAGSDALPDLLGEPDQWVRNGTDRAQIRAALRTAEGEERHVSLVIERGDRRDTVIKRNVAGLKQLDAAIEHADRNYFIAGYGAFRRPPQQHARQSGGPLGRAANLGTLFSGLPELMSLEAWATDLDYASEGAALGVIQLALQQLLPSMQFKEIDKRSRRVIMETQDGAVPLMQLSEGYQAMAAWAGDLLYRMSATFRDWTNPLGARGVLLIDEMDLHLHPLWKRRLVTFLDAAFPNLQIVATTHSPLSVQQCGKGELFVVRREKNLPELVPFKGDPSKLRLSELFLSPLIGLETLDSPKVAILRQEARDIELQASPPTTEQVAKLRKISHELEGTVPLAVDEAPALKAFIDRTVAQYHSDPAIRLAEAKALFGDPAETSAPRAKAPNSRRQPTSAAGSGVERILTAIVKGVSKTQTKVRVKAAAAKKPARASKKRRRSK